MILVDAILQQRCTEIKRILTEAPEVIEGVDEEGTPMCLLAAKTGSLAMVQYIVEYSRASMNVKDPAHRNILHYGIKSGSLNLVKYLVEKVGMSPVVGDANLITPFDLAVELGHGDIVRYFESLYDTPYSNMYKNPIRSGMYPDPSIIRVGADYYMVNSSFIFFPSIPISHSKDLIHWRIIGHAITKPEWARLDDLEGGRGYWAPDISYHKDKFYITATYRFNDTGPTYRKQIIVSSDYPEGPYSEPVIIDEDGIDPSIFTDDDGRRYMLLNRGARVLELNEDCTKQISEATLLYYGSQKRAPEGPHLLKKDGWYYLFLAEGGTGKGHRITVARASNLYGIYEPCPYNPIMRQEDGDAAIQRCGHGKPVMTQNGDWYMVYLCGRSLGHGYSILGRETALDPIRWTGDGWPIVNELKGPSVLQKKPDLPEFIFDDQEESDFGLNTLRKEWVFPRPPAADGYKLENGQLMLRGSQAPLSSVNARNVLLRRQTDFSFTAEVIMDIVTMTSGQETGMTCYYDENTWLTFALHGQEDGNNTLMVTEHIDQLTKTQSEKGYVPSTAKQIHLRIITRDFRRSCQYSYDGIRFQTLSTLENVYYLCDEGIKKGKRFTGAMVGVYVYEGYQPLMVSFQKFNYTRGR